MKSKFPEVIPPLLITLLLLTVLEIITSAIFPSFGLEDFRLNFNILLVLFLGFKVNSPFLPIFIFLIQYTHSIFSIESWAYGTLIGVVITIVSSIVKDLLHFKSAASTMIVCQIFQVLWFVLASLLVWLKTGNFQIISNRFWLFIPESIILSLISPFCFHFVERIWSSNDLTLGAEV